MPVFLIPIAIVGWKIYEDRKKKKAEAELAAKEEDSISVQNDSSDTRSEEPLLQKMADDQQSETTCELQDDFPSEDDSLDVHSDHNSEHDVVQNHTIDGMTLNHERSQQNPANRDPFRIQTSSDNLTFKVLGNRGSKTLPFPKISYR